MGRPRRADQPERCACAETPLPCKKHQILIRARAMRKRLCAQQLTRRFAHSFASPCAEIMLKRWYCYPLCRLGLAPGRGVRRRVGDSAASAQARGGQEQLSGPGCRCAACHRQPDSGPWSPVFLSFETIPRQAHRASMDCQHCGSQLCTIFLLACKGRIDVMRQYFRLTPNATCAGRSRSTF